MKSGYLFFCVLAFSCLGGCSGDDSDKLVTFKGGKAATGVALPKEEMAQKMDIPLYPGCTVPDGTSKIMAGATLSRCEMIMETPDSVDKARKFYRTQIASLNELRNSTDLMGVSAKKYDLTFKFSGKAGKTTIDVVSIVASPPKS